MAVAVSYPGVYIDEFAPGAPIQPAATNIAAILGPLAKGNIIDPEGPFKSPPLITSFDQFMGQFGARPAPGFFTWYSVRGFFENGGTACYVYRISNAAYAKTDLVNGVGTGIKLGEVFALVPGQITTPIQFTVRDAATPLLPTGTKLFAVTAAGTLSGTEIRIPQVDPGNGPPTDSRAFRVGDWVQVIGAAGTPLGPMARVVSASTSAIVIDTQFAPQAVSVKLMYDSTGAIRITAPGTLPVNGLGIGTTIIVRAPDDPHHIVDVVESVSSEPLTSSFRTYRLGLRNGLVNKIDPSLAEVPVSAVEFDVVISQNGTPYTFSNLAPDPASDSYYVDTINKYPSLVRVVALDPPPPVPSPEQLRPASRAFTITGGHDEDLTHLADDDFTKALDNLRRSSDVRLVSIPDGYPRASGVTPAITPGVQAYLITHCEQMADRFAVLDPEPGLPKFGDNSIQTRRNAVDSSRGYAALYYPWVRVARAGIGPPITVPPSGHVCGLMARVDNTRGVFKAPANEILQATIGVDTTMSDPEQGLLNKQGINVIRVFKQGSRPVVFGARTTATDANWKYVNIRRLFLFLEKSIQDSITWAIFEPNNKGLWTRLRQTITAFLFTQWQAGAVFGDTPAQAYYVRIDDILNTFETQRQGILNMEIGIRPTYPAEFIVVRIGIWDGGAQVTEG